ncbi:pre-mRNA splicing factor prp1 [Protomyces lactucae-debilis]|uniref:Pre-mRNA splicing factor prp1 n=1 Tax=Protomyces lactucae-debilis TaxID=2754530 RepID=A0A1Y2FK71_PROLT|nr:pre-mRNA splicing factor prp1 [Protomyces lactucae-debilis]ORY84329.1 pre-mRNA splicing factor prp1 [Protomyces lactucae-debilis]
MNKLAFLTQEAPPNYVAGIGRGATGFTTRSDIGPAREGPTEEVLQAAIEAQKKAQANGDLDGDEEDRFADPENETGLFANGPYDAEDEEADQVFDKIEDIMMNRRRRKQPVREEEEERKYDKNGTLLPPIASQFTDLKRGLSSVTDDEWANLPEVGDLTKKNKRLKQQDKETRFYAVPDSVLAGTQRTTELETSIGTETKAEGTSSVFADLASARDKVLAIKLDQASLKEGTTTAIDAKGYLTGLDTQVLQSSAEIGDVKKARLLLNSVTSTNPKHAPGWIAAARLEEVAGRQVQARQLAAKGCEHCPSNEDIWIESARLNGTDNAKRILAQAITYLPESVKIWVQAMRLETETKAKKRVMRKALEFVPTSVRLWKEAVGLEDNPADARLLLARATELIPLSVELWLALARLETEENARKVLNKARSTIRTSFEIWVAAARLEEQAQNQQRVAVVMQRAMNELQRYGGMLSREQWIAEAEKNEADGGVLTAQAIIRACMDLGVDDEDRAETWMDDVEGVIEREHPETARAIFEHALSALPERADIWRKAADFEKAHGTTALFFEVLDKACAACPQDEVLWLMYAKDLWLHGDLPKARAVLARSFEHNPDSEDIWLAAVKLEAENGEMERAKMTLQRAREESGTERIWIRSAVFWRQQGDLAEALRLAEEGLATYPTSARLWMIQGQIHERTGDLSRARETYAQGVRQCKQSVPLWILASRLEEHDKKLIKARALLDRARLANKANERLWHESVKLELRGGFETQARALLSKALQECPRSGLLWSEQIWQEPKTKRIPRATDALHKCETDPYLVCTIARIFWSDRKLDKAKSWLQKAIKADLDIGDTWGWFYKFLTERGGESMEAEVGDLLQQMDKADPHHGLLWPEIAKRDENIRKSRHELLDVFSQAVTVVP